MTELLEINDVRSTIHKQGYIREDEIPAVFSYAFAEGRGYRHYFVPETGQPRMIQVVATANALYGDVLRDFYRDRPGHVEEAPRQSPVRSFVEDSLTNISLTREGLLEHLMKDPGFLATYGDDFVVEFKDALISTNERYDDLTRHRELHIKVEHVMVVRMREDEEQRRSTIETIRNLIRQRNEALALPDNEDEVDRLNSVLKQHEEYLKSNGLRITETGDLESV